MALHSDFEWDDDKAASNLRKHGVTFDDAAAVLADPMADRYHVETYDDAHSLDEDRQITVGSHPFDRSIVLIVSWTDRSDDDGPLTRIISARRANQTERRRYEQAIRGR